jgi:hypothetical protein
LGHPVGKALVVEERLGDPNPARYGPFGFQHNSFSRRFEYPWAYFTGAAEPGMRALDVGGSLSGFQFVLAIEGAEVVTVDPASAQDDRWSKGNDGSGRWLTQDDHDHLNKYFGTEVSLVTETVQECGLPAASFDRIYCLSVLEHVSLDEGRAMMRSIAGLLAPGGQCLLTVDLFLDVRPFGVREANFWGGNLDIRALLAGLDLEMVAGDTSELLGYPEFDFDAVVAKLPELLINPITPCLTQTLVLRRP